ncbi:MAG: hypothetical protein ACKOQ6_01225, partial [Bacteroidota bacterium]
MSRVLVIVMEWKILGKRNEEQMAVLADRYQPFDVTDFPGKRTFICWLLHLSVLLGACNDKTPQEPVPQLEGYVHENDSLPDSFVLDNRSLTNLSIVFSALAQDTLAIRQFYASRNNRFAWVHPEGFTFATKGFLDRLSSAADEGVILHGTDPERLANFCKAYIDSFPLEVASATICSLEVSLTVAWFDYASAAFSGISSDKRRELQWYLPAAQNDPLILLQSFLADTMGGSVMNPMFHSLFPSIGYYRSISAVEWGKDLADYAPGHVSRSDELMLLVKRRLYFLKDLPDSS